MQKIIVQVNDAGQKLFSFIKKVFKETKLSIIYKWFRLGKIKINGKKTKDRDYILQLNDIITVYDNSSFVTKRNWQYVDYSDLDVIYEDDNILIADKNSNVEIHSEFNICLDNQVRSYLKDKKEFQQNENSFIVSHVHRLDKLTSGLVIYAKNKVALDYFLTNITNKEKINKCYLAKVAYPLQEIGFVTGFIEYNPILQKAVFQKEPFNHAKEAILEIKEINGSWVTIELQTGRKHQIRATLSSLGSPIENDFRYGAPKISDKPYIGLNAAELTFNNLDEPFSYLNGRGFKSQKNHF